MKYKANENQYTNLTHTLSFGCSIGAFIFCLWRYFDPNTIFPHQAFISGFDIHLFWSIFIYVVLFALQIILVMSSWVKSRLSFYMPACIFTFFIANMIITHHNTSSLWFVLFVLYGIAALYGGFYQFLGFIVFSQLVLLLLFKPLASVFNIITTDYDIHLWFIVSAGMFVLLILVRSSITRLRFGNQEKELSNKLLLKTPNSLVLVDNMMCVLTMSRPFRKMFRISKPRLAEGRPLSDLFPGEVKLILAEMTRAGTYYETVEPLRIFENDGYYKITCEKMEGKNAGYFINFVNLTTIMRAKIELERATKAKNLFLAKMSHEIRTPLNAITGMSELILREKTAPRVREYANGVQTAGSNLLSIVNDILDFTKIESGAMEIIEKEYLFSSLLEDIINIIRIRLIDKPILFITDIESRTPFGLTGDVARIRQILINILNNAVKYTSSGYIILNTSYHQIDETMLSLDFTVSDSGRGIKPEDTRKVFGEFVQIDAKENAGIEGTGLGLAISKNLCNAMGGELSLQSEYGKGSTFTVCIPQKISDTRCLVRVNEPEKKGVLVYEGRELYAKSISNSLSNLGVPHKIVSSFSAFNEALLGVRSSYIDEADPHVGKNDEAWPFVFVVSIFYDSVHELVQRHKLNTIIVVLAEVDDISGRNVCRIPMPTNTVSIARVLNNETTDASDTREQQKVNWIAPTAKILIVDDINTNIIVAEGLLLPYKMQVSGCLSGYNAISLVKQKHYDIIFLDHMMPDMDGIETAMALRQLPDFKNTPIIALTANAIHGAEEMFKNNGFDALLVKPIEVPKLNAILEKWVPEDKRVYVEHSISKAASIVARAARLARTDTGSPPVQEVYPQQIVDEKKISPVEDTAETTPAPELEIPGIDFDHGIKNSGGSLDFYIRVLTTYHQEGLGYTVKLEQAWNDNDMNRWVTYIHGIKSASANVGAKELAEKAKRLEDAGRSNNKEYAAKEYPIFAQEFNDLLAAINEELKKRHISKERNEHIAGLPDYPFLKERLMTFKTAVENLDISVMEEILNTLAAHVWDKQNEDMLEQIQSCVLLGDYEAAEKHAENMLEQIGE